MNSFNKFDKVRFFGDISKSVWTVLRIDYMEKDCLLLGLPVGMTTIVHKNDVELHVAIK